jgi:formamidopyrimidine-DNA glycosylase
MPELPEVEITARRLSTALEGAKVESALATGVATLKTFEPSLDALTGARIERVRRIGKMLAVDFDPPSNGLLLSEHPRTNDGAGPLTLLIHLMSAGRLQLFDKRASLKDRRSRLLVRIADGRELRLREFGTKQAAWAKLLRRDEVDEDEMVATLGPDAWPAPLLEQFREAIAEPRHLHPLLRHQRDIAGIGRSWVDEILWEAKLSPFKKGSELRGEEVKALHDALHVLGDAIDHYEEVVGEQIPDKMPMPLQVHRREGEPCPRCGTTIEAVFFAEHQMNYCPEEQTGGRVLKDRRLSRLLK